MLAPGPTASEYGLLLARHLLPQPDYTRLLTPSVAEGEAGGGSRGGTGKGKETYHTALGTAARPGRMLPLTRPEHLS